MGGGDEADRSTEARARHLEEGVLQIWMPVTHADEHPERDTSGGQRTLELGGLSSGCLGERGNAVEVVVVTRDLLDPGGWDVPTPKHVGEERSHVRGALRTAERDQHDRVERSRSRHESNRRGVASQKFCCMT